jgi:hypothetical protein
VALLQRIRLRNEDEDVHEDEDEDVHEDER